ncbi:MAG: class II aldolase/adducin family protein [Candidatus Zixiibacteriota bacterium]|nr:MAG: class II aldolase/adducin family protein [candidate division Zixibacteria bacterium]
MNYNEQRKLIVEFGRRLYQNGYVPGTGGNLSCRIDKNTVLITPTGAAKGHLCSEELVLIDLEGNQISGNRKPSSEMPMHLFVYNNRPHINAVCHAHPPYATASSIVGKKLPEDILPEVILSIGDIPLTDYAPPGTDAVPKSLKEHINDHCAFILRNHGVLTIGLNMEEAFNRMETVEHFAKIFYISQGAGKINHLDNSEVERLRKISKALRQGNKS